MMMPAGEGKTKKKRGGRGGGNFFLSKAITPPRAPVVEQGGIATLRQGIIQGISFSTCCLLKGGLDEEKDVSARGDGGRAACGRDAIRSSTNCLSQT